MCGTHVRLPVTTLSYTTPRYLGPTQTRGATSTSNIAYVRGHHHGKVARNKKHYMMGLRDDNQQTTGTAPNNNKTTTKKPDTTNIRRIQTIRGARMRPDACVRRRSQGGGGGGAGGGGGNDRDEIHHCPTPRKERVECALLPQHPHLASPFGLVWNDGLALSKCRKGPVATAAALFFRTPR